jgi:hypothetical protein
MERPYAAPLRTGLAHNLQTRTVRPPCPTVRSNALLDRTLCKMAEDHE